MGAPPTLGWVQVQPRLAARGCQRQDVSAITEPTHGARLSSTPPSRTPAVATCSGQARLWSVNVTLDMSCGADQTARDMLLVLTTFLGQVHGNGRRRGGFDDVLAHQSFGVRVGRTEIEGGDERTEASWRQAGVVVPGSGEPVRRRALCNLTSRCAVISARSRVGTSCNGFLGAKKEEA